MHRFILALVIVTCVGGAPAAAMAGLPQRGEGRVARPRAELRLQRRAVAPRARLALRGGLRLRRMDTNHDRQVTRQEWTGNAARFDALDRNHDGVIDRADLRGPRRVPR